ncbi:GTP-binding protein [Streptomyces sp. NPDC049577]|uniref:GTP-binding protein n=1 Tax=Streptomyces sp. NPDC049577 TaxID=3155153 RepID=UPI0034196EB0
MAGNRTGNGGAHAVIGAIGDAGHGKTTLAAAIGKAAAKSYRQDARAVESIVEAAGRTVGEVAVHSAHSAYATPERHYTHFDASAAHVEDLLRSTRLDGVILVVSAPDSVQPRTRRHLRLARTAGLRHLVVFLNKCDAVGDPAVTDRTERQVREMLRQQGLDGARVPVVRGSALRILGGDRSWEPSAVELLEALDSCVGG